MLKHSNKSDIVFETLKDKITNEYLPGEKFLTVREIMKHYSVSTLTAQKIVANLQATGLLTTRQGAGAFISERVNNERKTRHIAFICNEKKGGIENDLYHFNVFKNVEKILTENNYNVIFKLMDVNNPKVALDSLSQSDISGIVLSSSINNLSVAENVREKFDNVVIYGMELPGFNCVLPDRKAGAYEAVKYLANLGHKRIVFTKSPGAIRNRMKKWYDGYLKAVREFNLIEADSLLWEYKNIDSCLMGFKKALKKSSPTRPTAIFIPWAGTAQEIQEKIFNYGMKIPRDLSIITFNDRFLPKSGYPALTTVSGSNESLGEETAEMLLSLMDSGCRSHTTTVKILPVKLIERESCRSR